jgi:hypothetical protein
MFGGVSRWTRWVHRGIGATALRFKYITGRYFRWQH